MKQQWYEKSFRRNLVDMHIEDWDERFLSRFSPEEYVENLKRAKIQSAMLYFHSHVGYSYYPTKSGKMHRGLIGKEDSMRRLVELCHKNGIDVIGYYSLIFNTYEEDRHPEWRIMDGEDDSSKHQRGGRYGHCCPNNPEYREYVKTQIKEISEYFTVEGMFYDMTFWTAACHCPSCTKRFFEETGYTEIPRVIDWNDPVWLAFVERRYEWIGEFGRFVTACSKKYMPHASVQHNCAHAVAGTWKMACTERVTDACDFCGGDLYGSIYAHSFAAKYYRAVTKNAPFEYMISRCNPNLQQHTVNRTPEEMLLQTFLTVAHHGAPFIIDAMDPVGTLDTRVYEQIGNVFSKTMPYEKYLMQGVPMEDVAIYYATTGRYDRFEAGFDHRNAVIGLSQTLAAFHVPYGMLANTVTDRCKNYKMIFAPQIAGLGEKQRSDLCDYVRAGGTLWFSGAEEPLLLKELLGGERKGYTDTPNTYLAPKPEYEAFMSNFNEKYPMPFKARLPIVELSGRDADVAARICLPYSKADDPRAFSSIHSNPPGELTDAPALVFANYGKGRVIWCAAPVEIDRRRQYTDMMRRVLEMGHLEKNWRLTCDARRQVELFGYETEQGYLVNFVDLLFDDEHIPVAPFTVKLKLPKGRAASAVRLLPNGAALDFAVTDGELIFKTPETELFAMFEILLE